ncbi:MAG: hypothetical protein IT432_03305 [Phycisphaerales bacterium]|nr:hypothetical protein [Phycisphaerales bacterium]
MRQSLTGLGVLAGIGALLMTAGATAGIEGRAITIIATNQTDGFGFATINESDGSWDAEHTHWTWNSTSALQIKSMSGNVIGELDNCHFGFFADPVVTLFFDVTAGNSLTSFQIMSGVLNFPAIVNGQAKASSAVTVTDNNGNGVTMTGTESGGNMYRAAYNGQPGTTFATLNGGPISAGVWDSTNNNAAQGFQMVPGAVTSIWAEYAFKLSAHDSASATSTFVIIPSPGAMALGGLALLASRRRR